MTPKYISITNILYNPQNKQTIANTNMYTEPKKEKKRILKLFDLHYNMISTHMGQIMNKEITSINSKPVINAFGLTLTHPQGFFKLFLFSVGESFTLLSSVFSIYNWITQHSISPLPSGSGEGKFRIT